MKIDFVLANSVDPAGLENSTCPLIFMSASGYRASEKFDVSQENSFSPYMPIFFCEAGQVPILRYFEACPNVMSP